MWNFALCIPGKYDQEGLKALVNHRFSHTSTAFFSDTSSQDSLWRLPSILTRSLPTASSSSTTVFNKAIPALFWKSRRREDWLRCRDHANFHALFALPKLQSMVKEFSYQVPCHLNDGADSTPPHSYMYLTDVVQLLPAIDINHIPH